MRAPGWRFTRPIWRADGFPERCENWTLESVIAGLTSTINRYDRMLSGDDEIGKSSLAMAAYEGRDLIAEIREKREDAILSRVCAAEELENRGVRVKGIGKFRRRLMQIDMAADPDSNPPAFAARRDAAAPDDQPAADGGERS